MESTSYRFASLLALVLVIAAGLGTSEAAGACGKTSPDQEAMKLAPCAMAAQDAKAAVSDSCCAQVRSIGQNPSCLCAVMLSDMAKASGIKAEIAITIPKRCNIANRPVGYKCGGTLSYKHKPPPSSNHSEPKSHQLQINIMTDIMNGTILRPTFWYIIFSSFLILKFESISLLTETISAIALQITPCPESDTTRID